MSLNDIKAPRSLALLAACAFMTLAGCMSAPLPARFVEIPSGWHEFKAVTADDAVFWVREFEDRTEGQLGFWAAALEREFVDQRGYTLIEEEHNAEKMGPARQDFIFESTIQGTAHRYLVCLWARPAWGGTKIRTVEYVAPKKIFDDHLPDVMEAIADLH